MKLTESVQVVLEKFLNENFRIMDADNSVILKTSIVLLYHTLTLDLGIPDGSDAEKVAPETLNLMPRLKSDTLNLKRSPRLGSVNLVPSSSGSTSPDEQHQRRRRTGDSHDTST